MVYYQNKLGDGKALAYSYRKLQHWNQWLAQDSLGQYLLSTEGRKLSFLLKNHFGKHALLVGVPKQNVLLKSTNIPLHYLIGPLNHHQQETVNHVEADLHELSILTGSIDLALLPHTLELVDNPRQLLTEVCRIVKPEGLVAICGFNPLSLWGIKKIIAKHKQETPWSGNFISSNLIKKWLLLADFQVEKYSKILFVPPITNPLTIKKMEWLEFVGNLCFPFFGGVYIVLARAKVAPLTPIRLKWKQQLSGIRISPTISGPLIR